MYGGIHSKPSSLYSGGQYGVDGRYYGWDSQILKPSKIFESPKRRKSQKMMCFTHF
eukprot:TRINITY_DN3678_c1_g1_i1.p1 TRINITY_DN3678_c1_g1~~TRINITY_DN3678_c1_g1_i1.p1  ORF type:complete len:56 (+),score=4.37 TRINITY_DN3678_c1_g1_i1:163-330(+)